MNSPAPKELTALAADASALLADLYVEPLSFRACMGLHAHKLRALLETVPELTARLAAAERDARLNHDLLLLSHADAVDLYAALRDLKDKYADTTCNRILMRLFCYSAEARSGSGAACAARANANEGDCSSSHKSGTR